MDDVGGTGRERLAMWGCSAAITVLVMLQAPGRIVPETKLDVLLDPVGYLGRALTAWDPSAGFGRVQNQAVGYLFPMGAFTTAGHLAAVPPWLVQRLWISLVIVVSFWGAHRVARVVGIASPAGRIIAGLAYALSPATLGVTAFQSAGQVPYALAPWVLVPLLAASEGSDPRRVAARSALWIAAMGGVNGASAFAVLPLVLVWFTTRAPGPARRRLLRWWIAGAATATLWWLVPLLVSVRYGIRFTDFTETASLTTWTESGTEVLRGSGNWLSFIQTDAGLWLPGAKALSADRGAIAGSTLVAAAGLWGLARRDAPGRTWLIPSLVLGATVMGIGYAGAWGGPFAGTTQTLLDGVLVPFRNVHKFSAVLRLPLAIGVGHLVTVAARSWASSDSDDGARVNAPVGRRWLPVAAPGVALTVLVLAVLPAVRGQLTAPGSFSEVPAAWRNAGAWLDARDDGGRTLLLPGSAFGEYQWGRPLDEPISSIQGAPWAVRDLIPLGGNGSTRLLDAVDSALQDDALPPGFLAALQRSGVRYLLVRNDLDPVRSGGPRPATIRRLLATEPELEVVASFGPVRTDPGNDLRVASVPGTAATEAFRSIDIYEVPDPVDRATAYPAAGAAVTSGGPEAVLDLEPELTDRRAVVLSIDEGASTLPEPVLVATDTARRRDVRFGAIRDNASYTLTSDERSPTSGTDPVDRWPADRPTGLTSARVDGAATLSDSVKPPPSLRPEQQPYAAFDRNPRTAWGPAIGRTGEWVQVELDVPTELGSVTIRIPERTGKRIGVVRVVTDQGEVTGRLGGNGSVAVALPQGATTTVRVVIDEIVGVRPVAPIAISEIEIDGVEIHRPLVVPSPGAGDANVVSVSRDRFDRFSLIRRDEQGELDREFSWGGAREVAVRGKASAAVGDLLDTLLATATGVADPGAVEVSATSQLRSLPAFAPSAAVDGDVLTSWISQPEATAPALTLRWSGPVPVDTVGIDLLDKVGDPVNRVIITAGGVARERDLPASGQVSFPSITTDELTISFPHDPSDLTSSRQIAVAEVAVPALLGRTATTPDRAVPIVLACGDGPPVTLDDQRVATRATTTVGALVDGSPIPWEACDPIALDPGTHRIAATPGSLLVSTIVVEPVAGIASPPPARRLIVGSWGAEARRVKIAAGGAAILATTENANDGWEATLDGEALTPIRVDGWRQGWRVPAGAAATIELRYRPAMAQQVGLAFGFLALLCLLGAAILPTRRSDGDAGPWVPPIQRPWSPGVAISLAVGAGVALGGLVALVALPLIWLPHRARRLPMAAASAMTGAGLVAFAWPDAEAGGSTGTFSGPAQALAVTAIVAVALALLPDGEREPSRSSSPRARAAAGSTPSIRGRFDRRRR